MKTRILGLIAIFIMALSTQAANAQRIKVNAVNDDISYYLDLKAIASTFGDSRDLEDFERRINDFDARISNLDLNSDGDVDYLRVIETSENNTHVVVIQAILDQDVFQDVATIVVERDRYRRSYVQVIGDPYIYGSNYIIEPVFYNTARILSWFWSPYYRAYYSPYYWRYYPRHYHYRRPVHINIYLSHVHGCINYNHHYRYSNNWRSDYAYNLHRNISRNDYGIKHADRDYSRRNESISNRYEMDRKRNSDYVKMGENQNRDYRSNRATESDNVYNRSTRRTDFENRTYRNDNSSGKENSHSDRYSRTTINDNDNGTSIRRNNSNRIESNAPQSRNSNERITERNTEVRSTRPSVEYRNNEHNQSVQRSNSSTNTSRNEINRSNSGSKPSISSSRNSSNNSNSGRSSSNSHSRSESNGGRR
jgi:hypothetical protein